ncbi:SMI1/KNR4 family protein [Solibacillus sp. Sa1YVA6]|uniref:SMI1/KNR4 family protein n=1 Tax=Solibacillus merdavium TaxID=2762218 RepID=A0ABR8XMB0_9BACL|nr:SMI1/KNR4 family protein [Solibacillus merdavium]
MTLLPTSEIINNWCFLQEEFDPELKPFKFLWNSKWIPIANNGGGDYLCIDNNLYEAGAVGQVLYFWHDWEDRSIEKEYL